MAWCYIYSDLDEYFYVWQCDKCSHRIRLLHVGPPYEECFRCHILLKSPSSDETPLPTVVKNKRRITLSP